MAVLLYWIYNMTLVGTSFMLYAMTPRKYFLLLYTMTPASPARWWSRPWPGPPDWSCRRRTGRPSPAWRGRMAAGSSREASGFQRNGGSCSTSLTRDHTLLDQQSDVSIVFWTYSIRRIWSQFQRSVYLHSWPSISVWGCVQFLALNTRNKSSPKYNDDISLLI